jgi:hypothetical protein
MHRTFFALVALVLASCSNTPPPMSCTFTASGTTGCLDFIAGYTSATAAAGCNVASGTYSATTSCSAASRVGRCTTTATNSGGTVTYIVNYYAPATTADAQTQCPPSTPAANTTYSFQAN